MSAIVASGLCQDQEPDCCHTRHCYPSSHTEDMWGWGGTGAHAFPGLGTELRLLLAFINGPREWFCSPWPSCVISVHERLLNSPPLGTSVSSSGRSLLGILTAWKAHSLESIFSFPQHTSNGSDARWLGRGRKHIRHHHPQVTEDEGGRRQWVTGHMTG